MGRIYSSATATIAWLGVEGQNSAVGLEYIGRIARALKDSWSEQTVDFTTDLRVWFQKNPRLAHAMTTPPRGGEPHILLNSRIWDGILRLFQRDYWQRSWIQQEIVLSQSVRLWCGPSQSPMDDVYKLADWLVDFRLLFGARGDRALDLGPWQDVIGEWRHSMVHDFVDCVHHFSGLRRTFSTSPSSVDQKQNPMLFHLLRTAGDKFKSTDPRDKLYSLLGLLPLCLIPDYTHSVELVYTEFTKSCLQGQGGLSYLELAGPGTLDDLTEVQRLFLPSWAINWDALSSQVRPKSRRPKSNQPTKFSINARFDGNVLCIDGNSICAIEAHSKETNDMVKFFTEIIHGFARNNPGGSPVVEFFRAVCLDVEPGKEHGIGLAMAMITMDAGFDVLDRVVHALRCRLGMSIKDILNCFDHFPESADRLYRDVGFGSMFRAPDLPVDSTTVEDYLRIHQQNIPDIYYKRSDDELVSNFAKFNLFMTAKGYAGWGPAAAQYGDLVSLVPGCEFPLLLRQVDDYFILLGPCWVLGLMDGEYYKGRRDIADDLREFRIM
ncbi:hypothetical protein TruAng_000731 [Truncatella angustata]|nr:hypothetical protein TruAng_000731 [Truncatella angustata]